MRLFSVLLTCLSLAALPLAPAAAAEAGVDGTVVANSNAGNLVVTGTKAQDTQAGCGVNAKSMTLSNNQIYEWSCSINTGASVHPLQSLGFCSRYAGI